MASCALEVMASTLTTDKQFCDSVFVFGRIVRKINGLLSGEALLS